MDNNNRIKELRKQIGYTQQQLADFLYLDKTSVSKWETYKNLPNQNILIKLCSLFNVSLDYLLCREVDTDSLPISNHTVVSIGRGGERVVYEINDEDAAIVNAFIEKMAKKNS